MPGQEEDISPYATFHLLGMREEANKKAGITLRIFIFFADFHGITNLKLNLQVALF